MKRTALAIGLSLLLGGCTGRGDFGNDASLYQTGNDTAVLSPGTRAVRIGESGPTAPACAAGQVVNLSPSGLAALPVRTAPFDEASEVARLDEGARVYLCTRSLDQRWQGVVVPPADAPDSDCGVTARLDASRDYAGPCRAGWVLGTYLRPGIV